MPFHNVIGMSIVFLACMIIAISSFSRTNKEHPGKDTLADKR